MLTQLNKSHTTNTEILNLAKQSLSQFLKREDIGFSQLPRRSSLWSTADELGKKLRNKYNQIVVVGLGGSSLGIKAFSQALYCENIFFIDNVDVLQYENVLQNLKDPQKTLWAFISKSGSTIETLCTLEFASQWYLEKKLDLINNSIVISENKKSPLTQWADQHNIPRLEIPLDVGGRYSVLSPVGMFVASFLNLNVEAFKLGSQDALNSPDVVSEFIAQSLQSFQRQEAITLFWFYNSSLFSLGGWIQQLWAESLGKKVNLQGQLAPFVSTPMYSIGASDQHSILQQVMEGRRDKFVVFFRFEKNEAGKTILIKPQFKETQSLAGKTMGTLLGVEADATEQSLRESGVSTLAYSTKVVDEKSLGYLFMFFQLAVAAIGEALQINAFDQPGVELGKRLANEKLNKAKLSDSL